MADYTTLPEPGQPRVEMCPLEDLYRWKHSGSGAREAALSAGCPPATNQDTALLQPRSPASWQVPRRRRCRGSCLDSFGA